MESVLPVERGRVLSTAGCRRRRQLVCGALLLLMCAVPPADAKIDIQRAGCGDTKVCLFKPAGCDPQLDCTIGIIFYVSGPNQLTVQMVAQSLQPHPQLQYIAVGFSKDARMGDDYVSECVLSPSGSAFDTVEVFASFNHANSNDRIYLEGREHAVLYSAVEGGVVEGRLQCQFVQQLVPQLSPRGGALWSLDRQYFVIGATGSAQHDEVNAHDLSMGSHFYPLVSDKPVNPSLIGPRLYDLPPPRTSPPNATSTNAKARAVVFSSAPPSLSPSCHWLWLLACAALAANVLARA